ncbi:GNAT family N-acetyltransferase [Flavobacterium sp. '19STA2R22 D10 B1']|uniref:GNAT family N-acetyltransferase n=1 Tax=Flavobacterium aerium TaxID=3037261 RepID=UPI00278BC3A9|nr:GNAT family N-acetyltransferase [Flavobacterium sp. '19STA2R22 D10 B1']
MSYTVRPYKASDSMNWNTFISRAKNATFLFHRDFMEYHDDRFQDHSLIVLEKDKWIAVLPANRVDELVYSHQGLTYGGLVYDEKLKLFSVIEIVKSIMIHLQENGITKLHLKLIPSIYCDIPSEELHYALFLADAKLVRRDTLAVIDLTQNYAIAKGRIEGVKKGEKHSLIVKEEEDFKSFWEIILMPTLERKHQAKPVHSLVEIEQLKQKFPKSIRQFNVYYKDRIVAGTTIFESKNVFHAQYIAADEDKNELGSLDFLYYTLLKTIFKNKHYFDFGISNEDQGRKLNQGLSFWKESFGARTIVQDFYEIDTTQFFKLDNVIL